MLKPICLMVVVYLPLQEAKPFETFSNGEPVGNGNKASDYVINTPRGSADTIGVHLATLMRKQQQETANQSLIWRIVLPAVGIIT